MKWLVPTVLLFGVGVASSQAVTDPRLAPWPVLKRIYDDKADKAAQGLAAQQGVALRSAFKARGVDAKLMADDLMEAGLAKRSTPAVAAVHFQYAYDLGKRHPVGYGVAIRAVEQLDKLLPKEAHEWNVRLLTILQAHYNYISGLEKPSFRPRLIQTLVTIGHERTIARDHASAARYYSQALRLARQTGPKVAEAIQGLWEGARDRAATQLRIDAYEMRLADNPGDTRASAELVQLYIVDLDDPKKAQKLLDAVTDASYQKFVPLAAKPVKKLMADDLKALADWYESLAETARGPSKPAMLDRVAVYRKRHEALVGGKSATVDDALAALDVLSDTKEPIKPKKPEPKPIDVEALASQSPDNVYLPPVPRRNPDGDIPTGSGRAPGFFGLPTN